MGVNEVFAAEAATKESRYAGDNSVNVWETMGCFRHCNGKPQPVIREEHALYEAAMVAEDPVAVEALMDRAKQLGIVWGALDEVCVTECPSAYSLFEGSPLMEGDDEIVVKQCPLKARFAEIAETQVFGPASTP